MRLEDRIILVEYLKDKVALLKAMIHAESIRENIERLQDTIDEQTAIIKEEIKYLSQEDVHGLKLIHPLSIHFFPDEKTARKEDRGYSFGTRFHRPRANRRGAGSSGS